jgi:D-aminopeptidase
VAVNALGSAILGAGRHFWAAPFELGDEFGGLGPGICDPGAIPAIKGVARTATTIAIVATDAALTQAQATRMAVAAHDGMARALVPSHTPMDGDLVFAASLGTRAADPLLVGHGAALCLARAIARGVYAARPAPGDALPCWSDLPG